DVVEVFGGQEHAVREHVEHDAHDDEQHQHQQEAQIEAGPLPQVVAMIVTRRLTRSVAALRGTGRANGAQVRLGALRRHLHAAGPLPPLTPLPPWALLIQRALTTTSRLSRVIGTGASSRDWSATFFSPPLHCAALSTGLPAASATAALAASLPSSRES